MNTEIATIRNILVFFAFIVVLALLWLLQDLIVPLVLALFLALLFQPLLAAFERRKVPVWAGVSIIWCAFIGLIFLLGVVIYKSGLALFSEKEYLLAQVNTKMGGLIQWYNNFTGKELDLDATIAHMYGFFSSEIIMQSSGSIFGALGTLFEGFLLTAIYLAVLLSGIMKYENYLHYLGGAAQSTKYIQAFEEVKTSVNSYVKVKFIISLIWGVAAALVCWAFGLQYAFFWGFLSFILNFLPVVGAIIGLVPVFIMGVIQFDHISTAIALNLTAYAIHFILASVIEPLFLGSRTSLNTIVVIMGLLFWGFLWGIYGMFLSVPLMVLTKVILSQIEGAEVVARLLGTQKE
jgi:AI-2 transport protein TqsA